MTTTTLDVLFEQHDVLDMIEALDDEELDQLDFGVIGIDAETRVRRYNQFESRLAGLSRERVIGNPLFTVVAPCMNNYLVAEQFADALAARRELDTSLDYVFTLRMRPTKVGLRLLARSGAELRYVLVKRG